jgi:hypothetical protein
MSEIVADTESIAVLVNKVSSSAEPETTEVDLEKKEETTEEVPHCVDESCTHHQTEEQSATESSTESNEDESSEKEQEEATSDEATTEESSADESSTEEKLEELESDEDPVDLDKEDYDVVRVHHEYQYLPSSLTCLAYLVLFLHLINAILKLSDPPAIQCFPRPF